MQLENVRRCGQEQKVFHSSAECVQVSSLGLVVILRMEKDNNLGFFHPLFPICWCHKWRIKLQQPPYRVRAVCGRQRKTRTYHSWPLPSLRSRAALSSIHGHVFILLLLYYKASDFWPCSIFGDLLCACQDVWYCRKSAPLARQSGSALHSAESGKYDVWTIVPNVHSFTEVTASLSFIHPRCEHTA